MAAAPPKPKRNPMDTTPFKLVEARDDLHWEKCFPNSTAARKGNEVTCARLNVPLDHEDPSNEQTMQLPILRVSPKYADPRRTVFWNPGRPGADPTKSLAYTFPSLQEYVGNHTTMIAISPRGVGYSTPHITCAQDDPGLMSDSKPTMKDENLEAEMWEMALPFDMLEADLGDASLLQTWATGRAYGMNCEATNGTLTQYVGTVHTAKDMDYVRQKMNIERLDFLGHSYGTILGATYAKLFPDNFERIALDGVAPFSWYSNAHVREETTSGSRQMLDMFFKACYLTGLEKCALYDSDVEVIKEKFHSVLPKLRESPVVAEIHHNNKVKKFVAITETSWRDALESTIQFPDPGVWRQTAQVASDILAGRTPSLQNPHYAGSNDLPTVNGHIESLAELAFTQSIRPRKRALGFSMESSSIYLIHAADRGGWDRMPSADEIRSEILGDPQQDSVVLDPWVPMLISTAANIKTKDAISSFENVTTSGKVLFIGNTADAVTPNHNAKRFHEAFEGSGLLTVDGAGHCASSADPKNKCITKWITPFFENGKMPPANMTCKGKTDLLEGKSYFDMVSDETVDDDEEEDEE
ncbi:putative hydrolase [Pseudocercospora fuligena]|uniref:Putative hydrolase n=1 Tax=Pseudocercospora fuligena TaxID=685502 RepID=A0A8H6VH43_9PEZI|nr:putative hydrolase [Pseudocercospora fuligena]